MTVGNTPADRESESKAFRNLTVGLAVEHLAGKTFGAGVEFFEDLRREDGPRILDRDAPPAVRAPHELDPDGNLGALEAVEAPHGGGRIANEVEDEHLEFERLSEDARLALGDCNVYRDAGVASLFGPVGPDGALNDGVEFADRDALVLAPCILSDPRDDVGDPRRLAVDARECIGECLGRRRIGHRRPSGT